MSVQMTMPGCRAGNARGRAAARLAVLAARCLALLSPSHLVRVMNFLAAGAHPAGRDNAQRAHALVVAVSPYSAGWRGCLPRSIAVCLLCRLGGRWPEWSAGVRASPPFTAHAWVSVSADGYGELVGEPGDTGMYRALLRVTAGRSGHAA